MLIGETRADHVFVQEEQMMPFCNCARARCRRGIRQALESERRCKLQPYIREILIICTRWPALWTLYVVKNGPSFAGVGLGGEGFGTYSIASPTGEGLTSPRSLRGSVAVHSSTISHPSPLS